ncbi:MAG: O-antigen ligase family protein [Candidatus Krumholzibacteria bacterium]|jgi:O-antigen ligase|nr:O-antigen ligase family protein [Candidatus Krumholzibacteria bacterium]MDP6669497.1 O-antigen ligase family protein [Candidatus Krumholzibacteria bacterium]MDP6797357.1 O-antigen ligase family protein [Candidatus Krumholzibacteria bacterium]MDP7020845.1 O-antigen ligase family protein [Candidatus Krumholzibacteria bacterium]
MPSILSSEATFRDQVDRLPFMHPVIFLSLFLGILLVFAFQYGNPIPILVIGALPFLFYAVVKNSMLVFLIWIGSSPILSNFVSINLGAGIPDLTINRIAASILFLVLVVQMALGQRRLQKLDAAEWTMMVVVLLMLPGISASFFPIHSAQQIFDSIFTPFIAYGLAKNLITSSREIRPMIWTLGIVTLYSATFGFYEHFTEHSLFTKSGVLYWAEEGIADRIQGPFPSPSALGTVMVGGVVFFFYHFLNSRSLWFRLFSLSVLVIHTFTIFWSYRRSVWMGFVATLITLAVVEKRVRKIMFWAILLLLLFFTMNWENIVGSEVFTKRFANVRTVNDRWNIWLTTFEIAKAFPLFGCGYGNFGHYYDKYFTFMGDTVTTKFAHGIKSTHNSYLRFLSEGGPLVTIAYLSLLVIITRRIWRLLTGRARHKFASRVEIMVFVGVFVTQYTQALTTDMVFFTKYPAILVFMLAGVLSHMEPGDRGAGRVRNLLVRMKIR